MSSKDNSEERAMHSKSDNIEIIINDKADKFIEELLQSLLSRYQIGLETSMRGNDFIFDCVHLLYHKCHKINFENGGSYIDSPDRTKSKKATKNLIDKKGNKYFQYVVAVALNHEEIKKDPQEITKMKTFINIYNWDGISYSSEKKLLEKI